MTSEHSLVRHDLEKAYLSSIAYQYARYALNLQYEMLPLEVVHQAKRCLLDALGCAIGAYKAPGRFIIEDVVKKI